MSEIIENFERKAQFKDENEADVIRQRLEKLVQNILAQVEKRDGRFETTLVQSGSVYEGAKVHQPDEFDFLIRINCLTNKPLFYPCDKGDGHVKLTLNEDEWTEFKDEQGFFSPNMLSLHFKKLVNESLSDTEVPEGFIIHRADPHLIQGPWGPVYSNILGDTSDQVSSSDVLYSETHGPATTIKITWQGGDSYRDLEVSIDLSLVLDYHISKLPIQLAKLPQSINECLQRSGFHVVPSGFDTWGISFSVAEKEILCSSPGGFKACYRVLKIVRDTISARLDLDSSLVPSYIFKTVLLSHLFTEGHCWEKNNWPHEVYNALEVSVQGMGRSEIHSFFIPQYNLLSIGDHENKLRKCILEDMLNQVKGLKMTRTLEDAKELKRQVAVVQMIDAVEFLLSSSFTGNDSTHAMWNKVFVNIGRIPQRGKFGHFWNQFTDLESTDLDEDVYHMLMRIWPLVEEFFKLLLPSLQGEVSWLAHKFYIRSCDKKKKFELQHKVTYTVEKMSLHQFLGEELVDGFGERCVDEEYHSFWSNVHKGISPGYRSTGVFQDAVDTTVTEGPDKGLQMVMQRIKQYLALIPGPSLMTLLINFVGQIFDYGRDKLRRKLDYITIPAQVMEIELD